MSYIDDFIKEAEKDNREGDHEAIVQEVVSKFWPSGDPFHRLVVTMPAAGDAKADCNLQPIPGEAELVAIKAEGNRGKIRGVASGIQLMRQLEQHYGITDPTSIQPGQVISVKTVKTKVDKDTGKGGFIRIIAFLPKGTKSGGGSVSKPATGGPGF